MPDNHLSLQTLCLVANANCWDSTAAEIYPDILCLFCLEFGWKIKLKDNIYIFLLIFARPFKYSCLFWRISSFDEFLWSSTFTFTFIFTSLTMKRLKIEPGLIQSLKFPNIKNSVIVSVLWREEGCMAKFSLSPRKILRAKPEGFSNGSSYISLYILTQVLIQSLSVSW